MKVLVQLLLVVCLKTCLGDGHYSSDSSGAYYSDGNDGRYIPDDSGRYIPDYSGLYKPDGTGGYTGDGSGNYKDNIGRYFNNNNFLGQGTAIKQIINSRPLNSIYSNQNIRKTIPTTTYRPVITNTYNANQEGKWKILRQLNDIDADGTYHWEYETENRIQAEEKGKLHNAGTDNEILRAKGFYEYIGPDNVKYSIYYTADENGFVAQGDHLPTPPPIPTYQ